MGSLGQSVIDLLSICHAVHSLYQVTFCNPANWVQDGDRFNPGRHNKANAQADEVKIPGSKSQNATFNSLSIS